MVDRRPGLFARLKAFRSGNLDLLEVDGPTYGFWLWIRQRSASHAVRAAIAALAFPLALWVFWGRKEAVEQMKYVWAALIGAAFTESLSVLWFLLVGSTKQRDALREQMRVDAARAHPLEELCAALRERAEFAETTAKADRPRMQALETQIESQRREIEGLTVLKDSQKRESDATERLAIAKVLIGGCVHTLHTRLFERRTSRAEFLKCAQRYGLDVGIALHPRKQDEWYRIVDLSGWSTVGDDCSSVMRSLADDMVRFSASLTPGDVNSTFGQGIPGAPRARMTVGGDADEE